MSFTEITDQALHKFAKDGLKPDIAELSKGDTIADGVTILNFYIPIESVICPLSWKNHVAASDLLNCWN